MAARERMSSVDTAWLRMEQPTNLMMIVGVMIFKQPVSFDGLKQTLAERFCSYRRFRQKAMEDYRGAYWADDPHFDIELHVERMRLPGQGGKKELEELVSHLASTPLDRTKPLWQYHLVESYEGGSALIMRIHHCYADGIALIKVLLNMTDREPAPPPRARAKPNNKFEANDEAGLGWLYTPASELVGTSIRVGQQVWRQGLNLLKEPGEAVRLAKEGMDIATEFAELTMMPNDPTTRLKGPLAPRKQAVWAEPLPLEEVKAVGKALGCTVNDVLVSCAAGAIGHYLNERGDRVGGRQIRASVPVNLRPIDEAPSLGNHFGLVFLSLPIGITNPLKRVYAVNTAMRALKSSHQPLIALGLLMAMGFAPNQAQEPVVELFSNKASAVMSNVPGPQQPLYLLGAEIGQNMFWVPQSGNIGLGISILSYNGQVQFGLIADVKRIPDPRPLIDRFPIEFERLVLTVLMEPWE